MNCVRAVLAALTLPIVLRAQHAHDPALDSLALRAAQLTTRYSDRRVAVEDGYRRLSADFPGMGEHWLSPRALLRNTLDPSRPTLLIYASIEGVLTLLGVGFVVVTEGTKAPSFPVSGWPHSWHEHSGLLSDESGVAPSRSPAGDSHVWVLHVWTVLENPGGRFAPDNWMLPFAREGLRTSVKTDADAARALSLVTGGEKHLRDLLSDAGLRDSTHATGVDAALAAARDRADAVRSRVATSRIVSETDMSELRAAWRWLAGALHAQLGARVDAYMRPPHAPIEHK